MPKPESERNTKIRHLQNELMVMNGEYEETRDKYFELYETLDLKVEERTKQLKSTHNKLLTKNRELIRYQEELKIARDNAEKANRLKSQFLANMSHELRTPLNSIIGFSDLLVETEQEQLKKEQLISINGAGKRLLGLLDDLINLSKLEVGYLNIDQRDISIHELVRDIEVAFKSLLQTKMVGLTVEIDENFPAIIEMDSVHLTQIIKKLIDNAIKFTFKGTVALSVKTKSYKKDRLNFSILIKDSGIGIDKKDLQQIFKPFEQVDNRINRNFSGTGLGLALVKRMVDLMGGSLEVQSKPNVGTTFILSFSDISFKQKSPELCTAKVKDKNRCKILIIDDNPLNLKISKGIAETEYEQIFLANNGREALKVLENNEIDLVLLDYFMPGMDGFAMFRAIRSANFNMPLILLTADIDNDTHKKARALGFFSVITKPIERVLFLKTVGKALNLKSGVIQQEQQPAPEENIPQQTAIAEEEKENLLKRWEELKRTKLLNDINSFSDDILALNRLEKNDPLFVWAEKVKAAVSIFDIEKMTDIFNKFPDICHIKDSKNLAGIR